MITSHRIAWLATVALGIILVAVGVAVFSQSSPPPLVTRDSVADDFAAAYAGGNTVTACELAADQALESLTEAGLCDRPGEWSVSYWRTQKCQLPGGDFAYTYATTTPGIRGSLRFEFLVTGPQPAFKVTELGRAYRTLCDIYPAQR